MKVNLNVALIDYTKKIILKGENAPFPLTIKDVVINSVLNQTNEKIGGASKHKCYLIYKKIEEAGEGEVVFTSEEITVIKALVDKYYTPIIIGQVYELFGE